MRPDRTKTPQAPLRIAKIDLTKAHALPLPTRWATTVFIKPNEGNSLYNQGQDISHNPRSSGQKLVMESITLKP